MAYTLGEWKHHDAGMALIRLLRPEEERFVRAAAMSSVLPHAETVLSYLQRYGTGQDALLIEVATAADHAKTLAGILAALAQPENKESRENRFATLSTLLDWLGRSNKSLAQLQAAGGAEIQAALAATDGMWTEARAIVGDATVAPSVRVAAVRVLGRGRGKQAEDTELLASLLSPQTPRELQLAAVGSLGRINRSGVPEKLLSGWAGYGPEVRNAVLDLLTSRPAWAQVLLDRAEADPAWVPQIEPGRRAALAQHSNQRLAERAAKIFNAAIDQNRQQVIERMLAAMTPLRPEVAKGATVFANTCSACHAFGSVSGRPIGPDLATVKDRSAGYLVTHILDPNRAVEDRYVLYTVSTHDGRALAGMLTGEAGNSITLVGLDGVAQNILRSEVRSMVSTTRSLMPDGLEGAIDAQAMADLVAFLAGGSGTTGR